MDVDKNTLKTLEVNAVARFGTGRRLDELDSCVFAVLMCCLYMGPSQINQWVEDRDNVSTDGKDHSKALDASHVCWFEVALSDISKILYS